MLFPSTGGMLIDFDLSGKHAVKTYTEGFCARSVPDTERHPGARAGELLRKEHDCFSLGAVLSMYECQDEKWKELIKVLQHQDKPNVSAGLQVLLRIGKAGIVWSGKAIVDPFGDNAIPDEMKTSSPPKAKTPVDGK